jgi:hypothetical protein
MYSIIIIIFNNFRKTEHNHQQGLRRGKYQGGQRSSIFPHEIAHEHESTNSGILPYDWR